MSPREAFFAPSRVVPLTEAVGAVAAELVIPYPPGIPVLAPGDVVSAEKVEYLRHGAALGMYVSGPADRSLATIRVVRRETRVESRESRERGATSKMRDEVSRSPDL